MIRCMRTTLTLEADVASALERYRAEGDRTFKDAVNTALRTGLHVLAAEQEPVREFRTVGVSLGGCLVGSIEDVAEVLAVAEGEDFR